MASQTAQIQHTDSIDSQDPNRKDKKNKKNKSRRPANTAFRQQRLKAWQPILTPKTVLPLFFAVGIIFAPIGGLLLWASTEVQEISIDYSDCMKSAPNITRGSTDGLQDIPANKVIKTFKSSDFPGKKAPQWGQFVDDVTYDQGDVFPKIQVPNTKICRLQFDIEDDLKAPVFMYYRLSNFYQNHRRYVKSYDQSQMEGNVRSNGSIKKGDCAPLDVDPSGKVYYPCGLIANSIFNDTLQSPSLLNPAGSSGNSSQYTMTVNGIAWNSDKDLFKKTQYDPDQVVPPPNWRKKWPEYNSTLPPPNLGNYEQLMVWMRTAGLPTFSKLALRNDHDTMTRGRYQVEIWDEFNVLLYSGTKEMLISTRTVMGGKNPFLGIAYLVVGGICILLGALFTVTHIIKPRKLGDHTYLNWNNEPTSTATATGRSLRPGDNTTT